MHSAEFVHCTPNAEQLIVEMARVSNPKNQGNHATAPGLLRYLIKHKHWSPFEMATMAVEINTNRAVAPQILRHGKGFSFQEFSQRYSSVDELPSISLPLLRRQDLKNKQASHDDLEPDVVAQLHREIAKSYESSLDLYRMLLANGVAKECAREVLPLGTPTRLYMHGNLRSWIHYIQVRAAIETQLEHRLIADAIKVIFTEQFPVIAEAAFPSVDS